jgi:hypothetical protein
MAEIEDSIPSRAYHDFCGYIGAIPLGDGRAGCDHKPVQEERSLFMVVHRWLRIPFLNQLQTSLVDRI